jgi:DNA-binding NarL/FixJ family response regulator
VNTQQPTLNIAVVDDHELLRVGVVRAIAAVNDWRVVHSVGSVDELMLLDLDGVDVVVLDMVTPGVVAGTPAIATLRQHGLEVIVLTALDTADLVDEATRLGAIDVVSKSEGPDRLRDAIARAVGRHQIGGAGVNLHLTPREREVLQCISGGLRNQEIATKLDISLSAVKRHLERIMDKTGIHTRNGLAALPTDTL